VNAYGWQKSSYSGDSSNCLELHWQKSSFSGEAGNCLEMGRRERANGVTIATSPSRTTLLRESDDPATVLATTPARLAALLAGLKANRLI
jgi:hypothetical protein